MKKSKLPIALVAVLIGAVTALYVSQLSKPPPEEIIEPLPLADTEFEEPAVQYTVPEFSDFVVPVEPQPAVVEAEEPVLPNLADSDASVQQALAAVFDLQRFRRWLVLNDIINRFVVIVDNLDQKSIPTKYMLNKPAPGSFLVSKNNVITIDPANAQRYTIYIQLLQAVDTQALMLLYVRFYPLFQQSYEELGYPDRYFNNRLVEVIEHLLGTPEVSEPIVLQQPKVRYVFANSHYERLSAGQKILLRVGKEHSTKIKAFLKSLRDELMALSKITAKQSANRPAKSTNPN